MGVCQTGLLLLSLALGGSLLGFLAHNYPPARIFMGDSGSLFLGLFLAGLSLSPGAGLSRSLFAVVAVPALILSIPILDTTLVTVGRVLEGRPISQGVRIIPPTGWWHSGCLRIGRSGCCGAWRWRGGLWRCC